MRVVYLTASSFRTVNAGALRNVAIALALTNEGHSVEIISGDHPDDVLSDEWARLFGDRITLSRVGASRRWPGTRLVRWVMGPKLSLRGAPATDVVLVYNPNLIMFLKCAVVSRRRKIPFIVDVTEWLGLGDHPGGIRSPFSWTYEFFMAALPVLIARGRAMGVSEEMGKHLRRGGAEVLIVPPLAVVSKDPVPPSRRMNLIIVVSGSALEKGGKDASTLYYLEEVAKSSPEIFDGVVIHVLGNVNASLIGRLNGYFDVDRFVAFGWLPWSQAVSVLREADWFLLMRDPANRRNRYGYPSKIIECVALGLPVITNKCGEMGEYLDDSNSLLMDECSTICLAAALKQARGACLHRMPNLELSPRAWGPSIDAFLFGNRGA